MESKPRDTGCKISEKCLECPLKECMYESPYGVTYYLIQQRNREILRMWREGRTQEEVASSFGISIRTVQRAIRNDKD